MRSVSRHVALSARVALVGFVVVAGNGMALAAAPIEKALPGTTVFLLKIEDANQMRAAIKSSQFGRLLQDPAMKGLIESIEEKLSDAEKSLRAETGLSFEELFSLPQGAASLAVVPAAGGESPVAVLITMDAGEKAKTVADLLAKATEKAREKNTSIKTEEFKGSTLTTINVNRDGDKDPMIWAQNGTNFVVSSNLGAIKDLLANADGREDALAANKSFQAVAAKAGKEGQLLWYLDIEQVLGLIMKAMADQGQNAAQVEAQLQLTGINGLKAIGGRFGLNLGPYDQLTKIYLYAPGEPQGLLKLFNAASVDLRPQPWVPANVASYQSYSWDLDKMYSAVNELADMLAPGVIANVEQSLAGPQGDGLSFQKDVFGPAGNRITTISDFKKPITEDSQRFVIALELSDPKAFQTTLNKIFKLTNAAPKSREFLGTTIYDFEVPELPNAQLPKSLSVAIAKDHLLAGEQSLLEQVVRGGGASLGDNPAFQALTRHFPSKSVMLSYQRPDEAARVLYDMVKGGRLKELIEQSARQQGQPVPDLDIIDTNKIPEFSVFAKYLTQAGGFGTTDEDGALYTSFSLKPATP